jgi:putative MFS transporter
MSHQHVWLLALLGLATLFEGYDTKLAVLVAPWVDREFAAGPSRIAYAQSLINLGAVAACVPIWLADRVGRRPVMLFSIAAYTALTVATALSASLAQFVALQFAARLFMVAELGLVYVWISEEFPTRLRGRLSGAIGALAYLGAQLPALGLFGFAEGDDVRWRSLYWIGALLLPALPVFFWKLREPASFAARTPAPGNPLAGVAALLGREHRRRLWKMTALWFAICFWSAIGPAFVSYYVVQERAWSPQALAALVPAAGVLGALGYYLAGHLADRLGRRPALGIYLVLGFAAAAVCYGSESDGAIGAGYVALNAANGIWSVAAALCAELFPSELRATATALSHNLLGRLGMVAGPALVGLALPVTGSVALAVVALCALNLLCLPLLLRGLPETR